MSFKLNFIQFFFNCSFCFMQAAPTSPPKDLENLTYIELFDHFVKLHQQKHSQSAKSETQNTKSFTLYEDLKLILYCNQLREIHQKDYKSMESIINRPFQQIEDRYLCYLQKLKQDDLLIIAQHLKAKGSNGYLVFANTRQKQLLTVIKYEFYFHRFQIPILHSSNFKVREKIQEKRKSQKYRRKLKFKMTNKNKLNQCLKSNKQHFQQDPTYPKNEFDRFCVEDLDEVLKLIAQWKHAPKSLIVEKLHQLSGNLNDLDDYLNTLNEQYCWLEEEDSLLAQAQSQRSAEIKLLIKTKGIERVKRRIRFLGYKLPFEFNE